LKEVHRNLPIEDFNKYYFAGSNPLAPWEARPDKKQLLKYKEIVDQGTNKSLAQLTEQELEEKTAINNPVAKSKYDALTFTFKHQMWHNGQIAMIKRIIKSEAGR